MIRSLCLSLFLLAALAGESRADKAQEVKDQKQELEQIRKGVLESQKRLDSLKLLQTRAKNRISERNQKLTSDRKVISRLNRRIKGLGKDVTETEQLLEQRSTAYLRAQKKYLGDIRQTYFTLKQRTDLTVTDSNQERIKYRHSVYLAALASFGSDFVAQASALVDNSTADLEGLTGRVNQANRLKRQKEVSYTLEQTKKGKQEKKLTQINRKTLDESERIMNLQMAEAEMERIITRLEEQARLAERNRQGQKSYSAFAGLKGKLKTPFAGQTVVPFGEIIDPVTRLISFSPGISIQGKRGGPVSLVASGNVAYTGSLRGYGNFVIINHDNQYYTTYAGLGTILVSQGQHLLSGTKLALAGGDGLIKFELRFGRKPLDPVNWINFDSF